MSTTQKQTVPGFHCLLMGAPGAGKSHSIRTLIAAGLKVRAIFTEQQSINVLGDVLDKMHYCYVNPSPFSWQELVLQLAHVARNTPELLIKQQDPARGTYTGFLDIMKSCSDFVCDCHGESFGDACTWPTDTVLVIDSLTGMNKMIHQVVAGKRVTKSLPEYGIAQDLLRGFIEHLNTSTNCHLVITAHMEVSKDEVLGGVRLLVSTIGNKLSPVLPNTFSDFILASYSAGSFQWATASAQAMLKSINLPVGESKLAPDFGLMLNGWKKHGGVVNGS